MDTTNRAIEHLALSQEKHRVPIKIFKNANLIEKLAKYGKYVFSKFTFDWTALSPKSTNRKAQRVTSKFMQLRFHLNDFHFLVPMIILHLLIESLTVFNYFKSPYSALL